MSKFKIITILFILLIIISLIIVVWKSAANESDIDINNKTLSEIKYFESKVIYMFNALNNIEFENYQISIDDVSEKSQKSSNNSSKSNDSDKNQSSENESEGESESLESGGEGSQNKGSENEEKSKNSGGTETNSNNNKNKKYSLYAKGVLTNKTEIDWDYIKKEAELLENTISIITLDLYQISLNNNEVVNFSNDYDKLFISIKSEDKQRSLEYLNKLYNYLPSFIKYCNSDERYNIIISTKQSIYNAYSILDLNDWNLIERNLQDASKKFSNLLTDINLQNINQYTLNKCYVSLNRLINASKEQDKELFLIKYKNLLEDLNSLWYNDV